MSSITEAEETTTSATLHPPEKRPLPYFQCFASDWIAAEDYALMSVAERGLLFSMLNAAWVNGSVPTSQTSLARIVQLDEQAVVEALTKRVLKWFAASTDDTSRLVCPELERQRAESIAFRENRAKAGQKGGQVTQSRNRARVIESSQASSTASSSAKATEMNRDEMKRNELKRDASIEKIDWPEEHREWGNKYDDASSH